LPASPPVSGLGGGDQGVCRQQKRSVQEFEEPPVRILVVEDDALIREFVVEALREEGYHVIHAPMARRRWRGAGVGSSTFSSRTSS
jgi:hypothetical protein